MKTLNEQEERHGLKIAPLIDVVFLLLIFFLVTTTFSQEEKDIALTLAPADQGSGREESPTVIIVNVRQDGALIVGEDQQTPAELEAYLVEACASHPRIVVVIRCDRSADHRYFVQVLNACEKAGVSGVAVATFDTET